MTITNIVLIIVVIAVAAYAIYYTIKKKKNAQVEEKVNVDDKTYTIDMMIEFVKRRLDEITKINLYDIGLSEEELKRRKNLQDRHTAAVLICRRFHNIIGSYSFPPIN